VEDDSWNIYHVYNNGKLLKLDLETNQWVEISSYIQSPFIDEIRKAGVGALSEYDANNDLEQKEIELTKARIEIIRLREVIKDFIHDIDFCIDELKR
jgi:histidinol dehydrogenase